MMEPAVLDRLLMDRALGALPPDVDALLAAYLAREPDAAARAQEYARATAAARQVLRGDAPTSLPPTPPFRPEALRAARRRLAWVRHVAGAAAVLVVGFALGAGVGRHLAAGQGQIAAPPTPVVARSADGGSGGGFWSVGRLRERLRSDRAAGGLRLNWDSAVSGPTIGGVS